MSNNEVANIDWLSDENKKIIRNQFFPQGATEGDMKYCISVAKTFNLNPILKQIYFVPRRTNIGTPQNPNWVEKVEPLAGRDSFLTLAHRTGKFDGIESKVEIKDTPVYKDGKWTRENDLVATATVYRKGCDRPFIVSVNYREYVQTNKDGKPTNFWASKPETMLKKVAESQVLRKAFDITGLYAEEEYEERYINSERKPSENQQQVSKPKDINSLNSLPKNQEQQTLEVEIEMVAQKTPKEILIVELKKRGATDEEAGKWCYGKNENEFNSYLNDPASIDSILEEIKGF